MRRRMCISPRDALLLLHDAWKGCVSGGKSAAPPPPPPPPPAPPLPRGGGACTDDWSCSLGGECSGGKCVCDAAYTGSHCDVLRVRRAKVNNGTDVEHGCRISRSASVYWRVMQFLYRLLLRSFVLFALYCLMRPLISAIPVLFTTDVAMGALCFIVGIQINSTANHTWGGHALKDPASGKWVGFFSYMAGHCGLSSWSSQSMIISAVADAPDGYVECRTNICRG